MNVTQKIVAVGGALTLGVAGAATYAVLTSGSTQGAPASVDGRFADSTSSAIPTVTDTSSPTSALTGAPSTSSTPTPSATDTTSVAPQPSQSTAPVVTQPSAPASSAAPIAPPPPPPPPPSCTRTVVLSVTSTNGTPFSVQWSINRGSGKESGDASATGSWSKSETWTEYCSVGVPSATVQANGGPVSCSISVDGGTVASAGQASKDTYVSVRCAG